MAKKLTLIDRLRNETSELGHPDEEAGFQILKRYPTLVDQLLNANRVYAPDVLKRIGAIARHTRSERVAIKVAEVALKYGSFHPPGEINAAQNISCHLNVIADYTRSARTVVASANLVATTSWGKSANNLIRELSYYACEHIHERDSDRIPASRRNRKFVQYAQKLFPDYGLN